MNEKPLPIIHPNPMDDESIRKGLKGMAMVLGKTKTELIEMVEKELLYGHTERIEATRKWIWELFGGRERFPRSVIRAGRTENKLKFSDIVRKKLK